MGHDTLRSVGAAPAVGICEDDDELRGVIRDALQREGLVTRLTTTGGDAVRSFRADPPAAIVLDIGLPDADGRDVCQALRAGGVDAPVLFLTARDALSDRLSGFHAGGDDYLTKPFELPELVIRVHALLRRVTERPPTPSQGALALDPRDHTLVHDGARTPLTPTEFRVLARLMATADAVVHRRDLVAAAWPAGAVVHDNTLDTYLVRIRRKLRETDTGTAIVTVRGHGYVLR